MCIRDSISDDSPFDRYAAGDFDALSSPQRRGLAIFRSGATRCFECHGAPTFASDTFRVIGVDSDDPGRAGVVADGVFGAFKVPTLRNVAPVSYTHLWFALFVTLVSGALAYVSEAASSIFLIAVLLPLLAVGTRRLRDVGKSGWWMFYLLVPVGGLVILAWLWACLLYTSRCV